MSSRLGSSGGMSGVSARHPAADDDLVFVAVLGRPRAQISDHRVFSGFDVCARCAPPSGKELGSHAQTANAAVTNAVAGLRIAAPTQDLRPRSDRASAGHRVETVGRASIATSYSCAASSRQRRGSPGDARTRQPAPSRCRCDDRDARIRHPGAPDHDTTSGCRRRPPRHRVRERSTSRFATPRNCSVDARNPAPIKIHRNRIGGRGGQRRRTRGGRSSRTRLEAHCAVENRSHEIRDAVR